jgi:1,4-alpha-glucan branching enzyme
VPDVRCPGLVAIVLHAHLPYVRHPEHERSLEERWLHEALWETYLPLVDMLDRLADEGVRAPISISVSPTLAAMWSDPLLRSRGRAHLERTRAVAQRAMASANAASPFAPALAHHDALLARAADTFDRIGGDVLAALARHHREGRIHLFTTSATHAFLPGLAPLPAWVRAQIAVGKAAFEAMSGVAPEGLWLPECAFEAPIDGALAAEGVAFTVLDAHGLALATPRPPVVTIGAGPAALVVPTAPIRSASGVTYFGRDLWAGRAVWAPDGFPSDPAYREFHRDLGFDADERELLGEVGPNGTRVATGLRLHRVTGPTEQKAPYDPAAARARALAHAAIFVGDRGRLFAALAARGAGSPGGAPPISVAPFDAELFGHFWHEGPVFLEQVLRLLAKSEASGGAAAISLGELAARHPATLRAEPAPSTWGEGGFGATWTGPSTARLWRHIHHASAEVQSAARAEPPPAAHRTVQSAARAAPSSDDAADALAQDALAQDALAQAIVEALLLQSSDFAFMIHRGTTSEYAERRTSEHAANALRLAKIATRRDLGADDRAFVRAARARSPLFSQLPREALFSATAVLRGGAVE